MPQGHSSQGLDPSDLWDYLSRNERIVDGHTTIPTDPEQLAHLMRRSSAEERTRADDRAARHRYDTEAIRTFGQKATLDWAGLLGSGLPSTSRQRTPVQSPAAKDGQLHSQSRSGCSWHSPPQEIEARYERVRADLHADEYAAGGRSRDTLTHDALSCASCGCGTASTRSFEVGAGSASQETFGGAARARASCGGAANCSSLPRTYSEPAVLLPQFPHDRTPRDDSDSSNRGSGASRRSLCDAPIGSHADLAADWAAWRETAGLGADDDEEDSAGAALSPDPVTRLQQLHSVHERVILSPMPRASEPPPRPRVQYVSTLDRFDSFRQLQQQLAARRRYEEERWGPQRPSQPSTPRRRWMPPSPTPGLPRGVRSSR